MQNKSEHDGTVHFWEIHENSIAIERILERANAIFCVAVEIKLDFVLKMSFEPGCVVLIERLSWPRKKKSYKV